MSKDKWKWNKRETTIKWWRVLYSTSNGFV